MPGGHVCRVLGAAALLLALLGSGPARADGRAAAVTVPDDNAAEGELMDVYLDLCLNRFPDAAAFAAGAAARQMRPVPPETVKRYLHDDPGRGWIGASPSGAYVVTIEDPPYHACAVRRMQRPSPTFSTVFQVAVGAWAGMHKIPKLQRLPPVRQTANGATIDAQVEGVAGADGKVVQSFMALVTVYPGGQTEVRMVHVFPPR